MHLDVPCWWYCSRKTIYLNPHTHTVSKSLTISTTIRDRFPAVTVEGRYLTIELPVYWQTTQHYYFLALSSCTLIWLISPLTRNAICIDLQRKAFIPFFEMWLTLCGFSILLINFICINMCILLMMALPFVLERTDLCLTYFLFQIFNTNFLVLDSI